MSAKNRKRKSYFSLLGIGVPTIAIVMLLIFSGCPTEYRDWRPPAPPEVGTGAMPATPVITQSGDGFVFAPSVNLSNQAEVTAAMALHEANEPGGTVPVIAVIWTGANTSHFNIYWSVWPMRPEEPQIRNIPGSETIYYIRVGLEPDTEYFVWVEAVNANGSVLSAPINRTTRNRGGVGTNSAGNTLERMDYPRGIGIEPGDGQLTVWWNLYSRIGWNEVYVVRVRDRVELPAPHPQAGSMHRYGVRSVNVFEPATFANPWGGGNAAGNHVGTPIWPWFSWGQDRGWLGYRFGSEDAIYDQRQVVGISNLDPPGRVAGGVFHPSGAFPFVFESWREGDPEGPAGSLGRLVPYRPITSFPQFLAEDVFAWNPATGTATESGVAIAHWANHATITGLQNGEEYEIWIRVPNVWGERGFGVIRGRPGPATAPAPTAPTVTAPEGTTRNLLVSWNPVDGAQAYRVFYSPFNEPPGPRTPFQRVTPQNNNEGRQEVTLLGLMPNTQYFLWVAAEQDGVAGIPTGMITGTTGLPTTGQMRQRLDVNGFPVRTLMYVEVNDNNILNAGDYILEDGTFLFDYIVIFAANLRRRDCSLDPDAAIHGCTISGVHIHFNENVRHILLNRSTFIQPLQDKGIRVKLGLLGDWDGIGFGSMNAAEIDAMVRHIVEIMERYDLDGVDFDDEWSNDMRFSPAPGTPHFGSLADWTDAPDGRGAAVAVYPAHAFGWPFGNITVWRDPRDGINPGNIVMATPGAAYLNQMWLQGGRNFYETIRRTRVAFNELEPRLPIRPQDIAYQGGVRRLTISLYEFNKARWVTRGLVASDNVNEGPGLTNFITMPDATPPIFPPEGQEGVNIRATAESLAELVDFFMQPWYNQWHWDSPNHIPRRQFSPLAIDVSGHAYAGQNNSPNPTFPGREGAGRPISIQTVANRFRAVSDAAAGLGPGASPFVAQYMANAPIDGQPYGMMFFYNLRPASMLLSETPGGPAIRTVEEYLSYLTMTVFGQRTILTVGGGDRPKGF